jgi:hypothetical protein
VKRIKRYGTLADLIRFVAEGKLSPEDAEAIVDAVGFGEGLKERDIALAKAMNQAPPSIDKDPVFAAGVSAGYEAAIRDVKAGIDITQAVRIRKTFELTPASVTGDAKA